ncbi:MAG: shikimate kinase [Smithella sp.]|nr:shikimate kinase [Smithella sp.]
MRVVLIGYRATGKSTVGRILARMLQVPFWDTDKMVEKNVGMPIKEIVALHGWEYFRAKERETIKFLMTKEGCVIATGGGVVLFRENVDLLKNNVDLLKQSSVVVWLNAPLQDIIERLKSDAQRDAMRPQFTSGDIVQETIDTMRQRLPLYESAADHTVDTLDKDPQQVAEAIYQYLRKTEKLDKITHTDH